MKSIWKSKRFLIGFIYLTVFIIASIVYSWYFKDNTLKPMRLLYNKEGELIASSPFSPNQMPPLGSDAFGESIFYQILDGAKFTILFAIGISIIRVICSTFLGITLSLYTKKLKNFAQTFTEVFYYVPTVFIAFILIFPALMNVTSSADRLEPNIQLVLYQAAVLIFVAIPTLTLYISAEVDEFMKQEYIISAQIMGASRFHIIRKHLRVLLSERLFLLFMQHIIQTLLLIIHLALLGLLIGGVQEKPVSEGTSKPISLSNDWAGLIGLNYYQINVFSWIVLSTLAAFFLTILIIKMMTNGIQDALAKREQQTAEISINTGKQTNICTT